MLICNCSRGLARLEDNRLHILDGYTSIDEVLRTDGIESLREAGVKETIDIERAEWQPLVSNPGQFVIAGLNYRAHCEEIGRPVSEQLMFGTAPGVASHASHKDVLIPDEAPSEVDYEGEIGLVVGQTAEQIGAEDAWDVIAGIVPLNDVSARDVQSAGTLEAVGQAKGFETFKPHGPCLATKDEFPDINDIGIKTWVNGELRQSGRSRDMVFGLAEVVAIVSARISLSPGDIICTGTPGGVAHGGKYPYLGPGDTVEIEVEGLPRLVNRFVEQS